jgi:hypothetical protein
MKKEQNEVEEKLDKVFKKHRNRRKKFNGYQIPGVDEIE